VRAYQAEEVKAKAAELFGPAAAPGWE